MSLIFEKISFTPQSSLVVRWNQYQNLTYPLHFHDEYELIYIYKSYGTRYIGDSVDKFQEGDLFLVGNKLPHCWQNDEIFYKNLPTHQAKAVIIQFGKDFFSEVFQYPEFSPIQAMLKNSRRGIAFGKSAAAQNKSAILKLIESTGFERIMEFIQLLNRLANVKDYRLLASIGFNKGEDESLYRITDTLKFISDNYDRQLKLDEISAQFSMSPSAFCNYFKRKTGKTLVNYINEFRVAQSCKLLTSTDKNISEIAFECGFNNISNFNRTFKSIIGKSPRDYKNLWSSTIYDANK